MRNFTRCAIALFSLLFTLITTRAQQPAFPGAEGAGMFTTGGRGTASTPTTVFEVTNLNDDNNPGSLRYALSATATYRTVVFRVSGTIHLNSKLSIKANTTIAGQTAPGDGICIADHPVSIGGDNVIVRHIRFRLGDKNQNKGMVDGSGGDDAFGGLGVSNIIIDHCSVSWSADEALTIYRGDNLTIQWCFITEPLNYSYHFEAGGTDFQQHGYNGIQGGKRATIHHNLYADARNRNPRFAGIGTYSPSTVGVENVDFRNNVIYNWGINTVYGGEGGNYNVVNNYYKWGPNTGSGVKYRICNPSKSDAIDYGKWHVNGNYVDGSTQNTNNNWSGVTMQTTASDTALVKTLTPFDLGYTVTTQAATDAFESVLQEAGATLPRRDTLDQRIVNDVRNRTGRIIDVQGGYPHGTPYNLTVNAWPTLNSTAAPVDTDHDGMPDSWEQSHNLNPNDAADRNTYDGSGYTMLENYLNGVVNTDPAVAVGGTIGYFSQTSAGPSDVQTYTVAGYNLTGNVSITPPASYELSTDGITWHGSTSPIVLTPTAGTLNSTTIRVRLNATAQGTYAGNITHVSAGAATTNLPVNGLFATYLNGFGFNADMDGGFEKQDDGSYTTVTSHTSTTKWEVSAAWSIVSTDARTGDKFLHYNQASSSNKYIFSPVCTTTPLAPATSYVVQFWYRAPAALTSTTVLSAWATIAGSTGGTNSSGSAATASLSAATTPGTWYFFSGTLTTPSGTPTSTYAGIKTSNPQSPFFDIDDFVVYAGNAMDATAPDAATSPVATGNVNNNTIKIDWTAPASGVDGGGYVVVRSTSSTAPVPNANGVYIVGNTMGAGYQVVYLGTNNTYTDSDPALSSSTRYYYYIFTADKAYNYSATAVSANVMIDESTTPAPAISATGTLTAFSQTIGSPATSQTITVSGTNLTGNITITPPAGYELSVNNGTNWSTSAVILTPTGGTVSGTAVLVRLNATTTGPNTGNIVLSSAGATTINVAVSGNTVPAGSTPPAGTKAVVAKDGSGQYTSIQAAINAAPTAQTAPYKIYIRKGKYVETVTIPGNKPFIQLVGESLAETIISYDNYSGKANPAGGTYGTSTCGTVIINAPDVMFMNLSIENATGYGINANATVPAPGDGPQAVAVYTTSDRVVFYNCRMNGGQDTYYGGNVKGTRCYFKNCYVDGNTDFLFGSSTIIFDTCIIYPRTRLDNAGGGYVTAVNTKAESGYGYVFRDCKITKNRGFTFYSLGRPWQNDAGTADAAKSRNKTVFLNTKMGSTVKPEGWSAWDAGTNTSYITYGEYNSRNYDGTPVNISGRLSWSKQLTAADAVKYYNNDTVFVNANTPSMTTWDPYATWPELSAPFTPELSASNLIAKKSAGNTTLTWNLSWPMSGITCDLYRSNDKTSFSKINTQVSTEDSACNFSYSESIPPPGQTYYYIVRLSKNGYTSTTSDTAFVTSKPTITVQGVLGSFLQGLGTPSTAQSFVLAGENLVAGITVTPPAGFEVSSNNTTWFTSSSPLVVAQTGGVLANTNIYVRLNGTAVGAISGNIVCSSTNANSVNVAVSGTVQADPLNTSAILLEQWPFTTNNQDSANVRAAGVAGTTPVFNNLYISNGAAAPAVPAYSALHGQAFGSSTDGSGSWTTASGGPGATLNRLYYEQFTVVADAKYTLRIDSILLSTAFYNTSSGTKMAVVYSRSGFRNDSTEIKVVAKNGTAVTPGASGTFTNAVAVSNQTAGTTDVYAMLINGSAGVTLKAGDTLFFRIYHCTGSGSPGRYAKLKNVMVKGTTTKDPDPAIVTAGTLNAFSQTAGMPSAEQTYSVSGNDLAANIIITPPAGYQVSNNGTTWYGNASPLTLTPVNGVVAPTTIQVRLNATAAGTSAGNITHESTGATTQNVAVTGTTVTNIPVVTTSGVLNSFSQTVGKPTDAQTFKLSVTNVSGAVTITPPAGYEISADTGKTWYTAAQVPALTVATGGTLARSLMIRLNASAAGSYDGNVVIQNNGAADLNVLVTGIAYGAYTINPNPAGSYVNIFHTKLYTPAHIRIYNISGRLMGTWLSKPATNFTTINISGLPNGMYFVELERLSDKVLLRFIKQ